MTELAPIVPEPPRLLHARSELGYTPSVALALPDEPEAVPEQTQAEITREAAVRDRLRRRREAQRALDQMRPVLDELVRVIGLELGAEVRALVRDFERVERRVA